MSDFSILTPVALASATSANGTKRGGAAFMSSQVAPQGVSALIVTTIVTGSVVNTVTWEVSNDNSTFYPIKLSPNIAETTITATEAGRVIPAPREVMTWKFFRVCCTLSGAATAAGDLTAATYHFIAEGSLVE